VRCVFVACALLLADSRSTREHCGEHRLFIPTSRFFFSAVSDSESDFFNGGSDDESPVIVTKKKATAPVAFAVPVNGRDFQKNRQKAKTFFFDFLTLWSTRSLW
jgi:hypothetical protein